MSPKHNNRNSTEFLNPNYYGMLATELEQGSVVKNPVPTIRDGKKFIDDITHYKDWKAEPRGKISDFAEKGFIGLQNHDWETAVFYRNIFLKELK